MIFYGCPGEEGGSGKAFMARDGVFNELDAALSWHPDDETGIRARTSLANRQVLFMFDGIAAHAGKQPHLGRSALDAVELMNTGANFLREHIISDARVHYAITDAGGVTPSVVQAHAEVLYLIRAPHNEQVNEIYERIKMIAKGAALMTETTESHVLVKACSNTILNDTMQKLIYELMKKIDLPDVSDDDIAFASDFSKKALSRIPQADHENPIHYQLQEYTGEIEKGYGSTDVGDVSWVCPTAQIKAATHAYGTPNHSWQQTAQGIMPLAHKTTCYVAKVLGAAGAELICSAELLERAKQEHKALVGKDGYICPIPRGIKPVPTTRLHKGDHDI